MQKALELAEESNGIKVIRYPLSDPGIFETFQGEGELIGVRMVFVRLGGCSVGCEGCDTNYNVKGRMTAIEIQEKVRELRPSPWTWITGGEPTDHNLFPLIDALKCEGKVALITSGRNSIGVYGRLVDFLCVSPHGYPSQLNVTRGSQVNLVPKLCGTDLNDWKEFDFSGFKFKYVTPFTTEDGIIDKQSLEECKKWVSSKPEFRIGIQAHKIWKIL